MIVWVLGLLWGCCPAENGDPGPALRLAQAARAAPDAVDSRSAEEWLRLAKAYNSRGESEKAIELLQKCLARAPALAEAHYQLGLAHSRLGQRPQALAALDQAHRLSPGHPDAALLLGVLYDLEGKPERSRRVYETALKSQPGHAGLCHELGNTLLLLNQPKLAIENLEQALRSLAQKPADWLGDLGYAYLIAGRLEEARKTLQASLDRDPKQPLVAQNLGKAQLALHDPAAAVEAFSQGVKLLPQGAQGWMNLALALFRAKQLEPALRAIAKSLELKPQVAQAHFLRGVILEAQGQKDPARQEMQQALSLEPGFAQAKAWLKQNQTRPRK